MSKPKEFIQFEAMRDLLKSKGLEMDVGIQDYDAPPTIIIKDLETGESYKYEGNFDSNDQVWFDQEEFEYYKENYERSNNSTFPTPEEIRQRFWKIGSR